jgi:hypothetical protein
VFPELRYSSESMAKDHDKSLGDQPSIVGTGGGDGDLYAKQGNKADADIAKAESLE